MHESQHAGTGKAKLLFYGEHQFEHIIGLF